MFASSALIAQALLGQSPAAFSVSRLRTLTGLRIVKAAGAPTGSLMALSLENGKVRLIDAATGATRRELSGHPQPCYGLAFSPDGKLLATGDDTARIWIWDVATGRKLREMPREKGHKRGIQSIDFSRDGRRIATVGKDDVIMLWNVSGGNPTRTVEGSGANFYGGGFLPSGGFLTGTLKEGGRLYNSSFGLAASFTLPGGQGANDLAFNKAGTLAYTAGRDGKVTIWNVAKRERVAQVSAHQDWVIYNSLSPNGNVLATSSTDRTIKFWNARTGAKLAQLDEMSVVGSPIAFTGNGRYFVGADVADQAAIFELKPAQAAAATKPARPKRRGR